MHNFNKNYFITMLICTITMLFVFSGCASFWNYLLDDTDTANNDSIKYDCSKLTADQLLASIEDPANPTEDELYRTYEGLQCCKVNLEEDVGDFMGYKNGCILSKVNDKIRDKAHKPLFDITYHLPNESSRKLINRMANSNAPLVRGSAYILARKKLYESENERLQFVNNAIMREQNAKTEEELYAYGSILSLLVDAHFVSTLTPEIKQYLDDTTHHKIERIKKITSKLCNKNDDLCMNYYNNNVQNTNVSKNISSKDVNSKDVNDSVKYDCSKLTADQLLASIKNPANPTDDDLYLLYESLQCCNSSNPLADKECLFIQVVTESKKMKNQAIYNELNSLRLSVNRKLLFNKLLKSKTASVRSVAYADYGYRLYKLKSLDMTEEEILFIKNAIQREQNPQTDIDLLVFDKVTVIISMLAKVINHQDCFTLFGLPEVRDHLNTALNHENKDVRDSAKQACESGGQAGKQLCDKLLTSNTSN